jgi:hypothetical protein
LGSCLADIVFAQANVAGAMRESIDPWFVEFRFDLRDIRRWNRSSAVYDWANIIRQFAPIEEIAQFPRRNLELSRNSANAEPVRHVPCSYVVVTTVIA